MLSHQHTELLDQLRHFPLGVHDDAADALEMATASPSMT
jgi:phage terminase large subunit-like protein